jgi:hypothetical protein
MCWSCWTWTSKLIFKKQNTEMSEAAVRNDIEDSGKFEDQDYGVFVTDAKEIK